MRILVALALLVAVSFYYYTYKVRPAREGTALDVSVARSAPSFVPAAPTAPAPAPVPQFANPSEKAPTAVPTRSEPQQRPSLPRETQRETSRPETTTRKTPQANSQESPLTLAYIDELVHSLELEKYYHESFRHILIVRPISPLAIDEMERQIEGPGEERFKSWLRSLVSLARMSHQKNQPTANSDVRILYEKWFALHLYDPDTPASERQRWVDPKRQSPP